MSKFRIPRRLEVALAAEDGFALVLALGISIVLGIVTMSAIQYTTANTRSSVDSNASQISHAAAEAGMNDALASLFNSSSYHTKTFSDPASPLPLDAPPRYKTTYTWAVSLNDPIWTITATGTVQNPTQGSKPITRTLTRKLRVSAGPSGAGVNTTIWNYIYSDAPPGSCMQIENNAGLSTPLYVRGDLCLAPNAHLDRNALFTSNYPTTPQLQVGGTLSLQNNANIGSTSSQLNAVETGVGCKTGSTAHNPCRQSDGIYAQQYLAAMPTFTKPVIDLATWYRDSYPGPTHPCTSSYGPVPAFDNDGFQNNSLGNVNLTPASAYDCKFVDSTGNLLGELKWTPGQPGTLVVTGVVFFDGNFDLPIDTEVVYQSWGTMYFAGRVLFENNTYMCGAVDCTSAWDSAHNMLVLVAGSNNQGSTYAADFSDNAQFQGAIEMNGDFHETNNVDIWGSIIAHQVYLKNNAIDHYVPFGTPVPGQPAESSYSDTLSFVPNSYDG